MRAREFIIEDQSGLDFKVSKDDDGVSIKATAGGKQLGYAEFFYDDQGNLDPQAVWVDERFQGQGIGGAMYDYLKSLGYTIIRSWDQTDAGKGMWDKHRGADVNVWEGVDADQVLDYVKRTHAPEQFDIEYSITDHPRWELKNIPLSQLKLDPDGEQRDPYNRVNWVDYDTVNELMPKIASVLKSKPIVVDAQGWVIDGNHRATAAAEAGLTRVPAYVPAAVNENFAARLDPFKSILMALKQDAEHYISTKGLAGGRNFLLDINQRLAQLQRTENPRANVIIGTVRDMINDAQRTAAGTKGVSFGTLANTVVQLTQQELQKASQESVAENFADGKVRGKSRPGRVKRAGASCAGSVTDLRARAKKYGGERGKMYHWCANMKAGRNK